MHKKHMQVKETPYGYTFMHKKHVQVKETPYGYTFMHKNMCRLRKHPMGIPLCTKTCADRGNTLWVYLYAQKTCAS